MYLWPSWKQYSTFNAGFYPVDEYIQNTAEFSFQMNQIQLYAELLKASGISPHRLHGKAVLEVGAGRGGGLHYLSRIAEPRLLIGIDQSFAAVWHGRRCGLDLRRSRSERLPFDDKTFDYVICVDSINLVTDPQRTFAEMKRVLSPDGIILAGDFILNSIEAAHNRLERWAAVAGLRISVFCDATAGVQHSLERDDARKVALLNTIPSFFRPFLVETLSIKGSERYRRWESGAYSYYFAALAGS
jgi:SAM-dependent methyltransferase